VTNSEHRTLDDVAKALARGSLSRRQALKLIGASLAGAGLALVPGVASAAPPEHAPPGRPLDKPERAGYGEGGRFGKGGPSPGSGTCPAIECSSDSDCGSGCVCQFILAPGRFLCISSG
jgi:hypothetical protein